MQPLLWTPRSLRNLVAALAKQGHKVCPTVVGELLHDLSYSLQASRKTRRQAHQSRRAIAVHQCAGQAVPGGAGAAHIGPHEKKELVGNFKNNGREWRRKGAPELVNVHDFINPKLSRAVPYGVYDITNNVGWVSVGTDHDTASFAANAIRRSTSAIRRPGADPPYPYN
jgi:Rhodopirellula transposase DDE domain